MRHFFADSLPSQMQHATCNMQREASNCDTRKEKTERMIKLVILSLIILLYILYII